MPKTVYPSIAALSAAAFSMIYCPTACAQLPASHPQPSQQIITADHPSTTPPTNVLAWEAALQSTNPNVRAEALATIPNIFGWNPVSGLLRMRLVSNTTYLYGQTILVPILADYMLAEVNDFREQRGEQAAAVLAEIGPTATHVTLPAYLICLSHYPSPPAWGPRSFNADAVDKMMFWNSMSADLIQLCGGSETACTLIQKYLTDQNPQVRLGAACALGTLSIDPPYQDKLLQSALWKTMPTLAWAAANDKRSDVRFAALNSLDRLAFGSEAAPWQDVFPALSHCLSSPQPFERQWAARVLADAPVSPAAVLSQIRHALLDKDVVVRGFALVALTHIDKTTPGSLQTLLLKDLKAHDPAVRRAAAEQTRQAITYLWGYGDFDGILPPGVNYNGRYTNNYSFNTFEPSKREQRQRSLLLAGLVAALSDSAPRVRRSAALTLQQIGKEIEKWLGSGSGMIVVYQDKAGALSALKQAQKAMQVDDPALSLHLDILIKQITTGPHDVL